MNSETVSEKNQEDHILDKVQEESLNSQKQD